MDDRADAMAAAPAAGASATGEAGPWPRIVAALSLLSLLVMVGVSQVRMVGPARAAQGAAPGAQVAAGGAAPAKGGRTLARLDRSEQRASRSTVGGRPSSPTPSPSARRSLTPPALAVPAPSGWLRVRAAIAWCESKNDPRAENPTSTASGLYQIVDGTWDGFGGYRHASHAPVSVQEAKARLLFVDRGTSPWKASERCWRARL